MRVCDTQSNQVDVVSISDPGGGHAERSEELIVSLFDIVMYHLCVSYVVT